MENKNTKQTLRHYGLKLDKLRNSDYIFGASPLTPEILQENGDWSSFLPYKEIQNLNEIETYACVPFTILNCLEIIIKRKYGEDKNFADRFLAAISGTGAGGNSANVVCEFLRKLGMVPQEVWPFDEKIKTFEEFYAPIPDEIYALAKEFLAEYEFKYEFVPTDNESIKKALQSSPLLLSVSAWYQKDGKYFQPEGVENNHATTLVAIKEGEYKRVFDSYADGEGDPYLKDYDWNAKHAVIIRFHINRKENDTFLPEKETNWLVDLLKALGYAFIGLIKKIYGKK